MPKTKILSPRSILISIWAALLLLLFPFEAIAVITPTNSSAVNVLGQANFTNTAPNDSNGDGITDAPAANTLFLPSGVHYKAPKLFVSEADNNRILIYNHFPTTNYASADVVVGQPDFSSNLPDQGGVTAANTLNYVNSVITAGNKMIAADYNNNRVLIWNTIPTANNVSANVVIGQADFASKNPNQGGSPAANTLWGPLGLASNGTNLFIADANNHRVLLYNTIPTSNNASANIVFGQANFTNTAPNDSNGDGLTEGPAANTLWGPKDVFCDKNNKVFVWDRGNHRVLIYNATPTANQPSANVVVGQPDFVSNLANQGGSPAANTLQGGSDARGLFSDGKQLIISDTHNHRVLIYNTIPTTNNASADIVIGQANFTNNALNDSNGDGITDSAAANTVNRPSDVIIIGKKIILCDRNNNRVLIYE